MTVGLAVFEKRIFGTAIDLIVLEEFKNTEGCSHLPVNDLCLSDHLL